MINDVDADGRRKSNAANKWKLGDFPIVRCAESNYASRRIDEIKNKHSYCLRQPP